MNDKRYKFICDDENCYFKDGDYILNCYQVIDLLNEYEEREQQFKDKAEFTIESNGIWYKGRQLTWGELCEYLNFLDIENKDLVKKTELNMEYMKQIINRNQKLVDENYELRKENKKLKKVSEYWINKYNEGVETFEVTECENTKEHF